MNKYYFFYHKGGCRTALSTSRSEQAPGSEFQPRDESEQNDCGFWDLLGARKR